MVAPFRVDYSSNISLKDKESNVCRFYAIMFLYFMF